MADRLYTSNDADEVLSALRFETKLEKATLARIAFALSIGREGSQVAQSASFTGGEMKRPTFVGEDEVLFISAERLLFTIGVSLCIFYGV
jgi:DNA sulfur modification protein DndE